MAVYYLLPNDTYPDMMSQVMTEIWRRQVVIRSRPQVYVYEPLKDAFRCVWSALTRLVPVVVQNTDPV
jgi:hypothetical protein